MGKAKTVYCIIPAYNEEKTIAKIVRDVGRYVDKVVVVDDGSIDRTSEFAEKSGAIVLKHSINRDQGASLQTGNEYALDRGAEIIVHFDADGQHLSEEIPEVIKPILEEKSDIVFGSRFLGKKSDIPWLKNKIFFPIGKMVNQLLLGVSYSDPQSGFRAMNRKAALKIRIDQDGKAHCSEILYKSKKFNFSTIEVPITVIYNDFGLKFKGGLEIVKDLLLYKILN